MVCADHTKHHQGCQPHSGTSKSTSTPARTLKISSIFEGVFDAFKLNRFYQILNIAPSGHVKTIQNVIKDTSHINLETQLKV